MANHAADPAAAGHAPRRANEARGEQSGKRGIGKNGGRRIDEPHHAAEQHGGERDEGEQHPPAVAEVEVEPKAAAAAAGMDLRSSA